MSTNHQNSQKLSSLSARQLNWEKVTDAIRFTAAELGVMRGEEAKSATERAPVDPTVIEKAFSVYKAEFAKAATWSRRAVNLALALLVLALAVAAVGALLFSTTAWGGGILVVAGLSGLLGMVAQVRQLSRDQLMLEMIPAKYELALRLASSPEQYRTTLEAMLAETQSLRN
jgi:hypothetical protein